MGYGLPEKPLALKRIRRLLAKSQRQMADELGVSTRTIQSYEQAWRGIPPHLHKLAILLLKVHRLESSKTRARRCWEINGCSAEKRCNCPAGGETTGHYCWLLSGQPCTDGTPTESWQDKLARCEACPAMREWLGDALPGTDSDV